MQHNNYLPGTVQALLQTDRVLPQTKAILLERLQKEPVAEPQFFSKRLFEILKTVCNRLIPQEGDMRIDLAGALDTDLTDNKGNGWRYDVMPPDRESFLSGINGINETANTFYQKDFIDLAPQQQDEVLSAIQHNNVSEAVWQSLPPHLFFEELLSHVVEIYYCHPMAKDSIGDVSFADAHGWQHIQLNEKEVHEPFSLGEINA